MSATAERPTAPPAGGPHAPPRECDAIVIGAGHNGLVAANYLADAGLDVVVLERRPQIGGMTRSEYPIQEAPQHLVNHCAVDPIFWPNGKAATDLDLESHGLRWVKIDPAFVYLHPTGESVAFWKDPVKTADDIRRFSRADAAAYIELANLFEAVCDVALPMFATNPLRPSPRALGQAAKGAFKQRRNLSEIGSFLASTGAEQVHERFEHPVVRSAVNVASACLYPSSFPSSTIQMLILAFVHRFDCLRPAGGTQELPDALGRRLTGRGGRIVTDARVANIDVVQGRAAGVILVGGEQIRARQAVLAACDAKQALAEMLPDGSMPLKLERRAQKIPSNDLGWGQLKIDIACSGRLDLQRFEKDRIDGANVHAASHLIGTEEGLERGYRYAAAGLLPKVEDIGFYNAIPSSPDPTQAPAGQDCLYLIDITCPASPEGGWTPEIRAQCEDDAVARARDFYGGLDTLELGRSSFTNAEMGAEVGATSQAHVDWMVHRMGPLRPARGFGGFKTPVPGLYLGGAGCHPGAAVTGLPGHNGAHEVLHDLRKARVKVT